MIDARVSTKSALSCASRLAKRSASRFSAKTSLRIFNKVFQCDGPNPDCLTSHTQSLSCCSASAAWISAAHLEYASLFTSLVVTPFFCNFFLALSVASKKLPISLLREAKDFPAVTPNLIDDNKLIGSIFYLPSDNEGRLAKNSNVFSKVLTLACNFTIWLNCRINPSCVSYTSSNSDITSDNVSSPSSSSSTI